MARVQGMIQRLEQFTSKLSSSDENQILRLRHGKIRKGAYKGTRRGRFKHWLAKPFLSKEQKEKRIKYLKDATKEESQALAKELCIDISKRTPLPYEVDREVTVKDVKIILEASREDREAFSRIVRQFVSSSATFSSLRNKPIDAAKTRLEQSMMDRSIRHHDQMKQLHKEALEILDEQKRTKKSRRKPLVEGGAPLELKNLKTLKREIGSLIEEKMLSLALFHEAHEYAMKEQVEGSSVTLQQPIPDERRKQLLEDFIRTAKPKDAARKSVALLAAQHMLENGFEVDKADIPDLNNPDQKEALDHEIKRFRDRKTVWANQVADLLQDGKFKEARVVEDLARDSEAMRLLGGVRNAFADNAWDKFLNNQRKKIKKGKKLRLQTEDQKKIRRRGPNLKKIRPQTYFDRIRPWRGNHTRVATSHAKQMISRPKEYDGNIQDKDAIVEQTLGMLQSKYRELSQDHNAFQIEEIRQFLKANIHDRRVAVTDPVVRIKRPLKDVPLVLDSVSENEPDDLPSPLMPDTPSDDETPQFDTSLLETGSVISSDSGVVGLGKEEDLKDDLEVALDTPLEDDVFEENPPKEGLDSLTEQVDSIKEKLRPKSVSDQGESQTIEAKQPRQRSISTSDTPNLRKKPPTVDKLKSRQRTNWYSNLIKPEQGPPPSPSSSDELED